MAVMPALPSVSVHPSDAVPAAVPASGADWHTGPTAGSLPTVRRCAGCDQRSPVADPRHRVEITSPDAAVAAVSAQFHGADRERCVAAFLDTKHRLLEIATVSIGSLDHTFMAPREVLRNALLANAAAVVLAHNHPSGDPAPSTDDERITRRLVRAGELVGIEVLDHLIVGAARWISLARLGVV